MKKKLFLVCLLCILCFSACGAQSNNGKDTQANNGKNTESEHDNDTDTGKNTESEIVEKNDLSDCDFSNLNLALDCSFELSDRYPEGCEYKIEKTQIASVSNGKLFAQTEGKTKVTVTYKGQSKEFQLCITNPQISTTVVNKIVGNTVSLIVYGTNSEVEWESDNDSIATVENGVVTAMPSGCGLSTNIHAYVDGKDLSCQINVEPIPQLSTTYKIFSESFIRSTIAGSYPCDLTAYSNVNKVIHYTEEQLADISGYSGKFADVEEVMNLGKVDYSDGRTFAVYETYIESILGNDDFTHIEIYLVGTSQDADVIAKSTKGYEMEVSYQAQEGYGIISVWLRDNGRSGDHAGLVYLEVDGIEYCFGIQNRGYGITNPNFLPKSDILEVYTEDGVVKATNTTGYTELQQSSYTFFPAEFGQELADKFIDKLQDKAISKCVDLLFKIIF